MTNDKILRPKLFALYLLFGGFIASPVLKATDLREDADRITAMVRFINKGVSFADQTEKQTFISCYDWARHAEAAHSVNNKMSRILFQAKLLDHHQNPDYLPNGQTFDQEIGCCLNSIDQYVVHGMVDNHDPKKSHRLQAHGRIWYGLLAARFKIDNHYENAWNFLEGVKIPPYTRTAKLWQAHLIIRNNYFPAGNRNEAFAIASRFLDELRSEKRESWALDRLRDYLNTLNAGHINIPEGFTHIQSEKNEDHALSDPQFLNQKNTQDLLKNLTLELAAQVVAGQSAPPADPGYGYDSDSDSGDDRDSSSGSSSDDDSGPDFGSGTTGFVATFSSSSSSSSSSAEDRNTITRNRINSLTAGQKETIRNLKIAGELTHQQIADRVGCDKGQVSNFVKREGLSPKTGARISEEKKKQILEILGRKEKLSHQQIADHVGCNRQQVSDIASRSGLVRKTAKHITEEQERQIKKILESGESITHQQIAARVGCTKIQVTNVVTRKKLAKESPDRITDEQKQRIFHLKQTTEMTIRQIADEVKCSDSQVRRAIGAFNKQQQNIPGGQTIGKKRPGEQMQQPTNKRHRSSDA